MPELTRRYVVMAMGTEGPFDMRDPDAPFVLKPWKDPAALRALERYRDHCYPELARELTSWIEVVRSGEAPRGGVGARNEQHMAARSGSRSGSARSGKAGSGKANAGKAKGAPSRARAKRQARPAKRTKPKAKRRK